MSLIAIAVYCTEDNNKDEMFVATIASLYRTVDLSKHRLVVSVNNATEKTKETLALYHDIISEVIYNETNIGTAKAINKVIALRNPHEPVIKMDDDIVIHHDNWVDEMQEVLKRMPNIGVLGLKRKDLLESPNSPYKDYRSRFIEVPHEPGQRWYVVEECSQVMGSCTMLNPALLDKVGYYYQMDGLYGFDDSLMNIRSNVAGFINCFLPHIHIDHIDPGGTSYTEWKQNYASEMLQRYAQEEMLLKTGAKSVYYE